MDNVSLHELSVEELGALFPIILVKHKRRWKICYIVEKYFIARTVGKKNIVRIHHIGSTAIPGIVSKPTIDILLEIQKVTDLDALARAMQKRGYHCIPQPEKPAPGLMFTRGYTINGFKGQAFHVHVRYEGDWDEIHFCNYLKAHDDAARQYELLKLKLSTKFKNNRELYTDSKTDFVNEISTKARG